MPSSTPYILSKLLYSITSKFVSIPLAQRDEIDLNFPMKKAWIDILWFPIIESRRCRFICAHKDAFIWDMNRSCIHRLRLNRIQIKSSGGHVWLGSWLHPIAANIEGHANGDEHPFCGKPGHCIEAIQWRIIDFRLKLVTSFGPYGISAGLCVILVLAPTLGPET